MSTAFTREGAGTNTPRRTVASYPAYADAERAVDYLSDHAFPVERTAIVGRDLRFVEQITGRLGYGGAAARGAVSGAIAGFLVGWLFGIFDWFNPVVAAGWLAFDGLWFGAIVGAVMGLIFHALTRGRRDFSSVSGLRPERFDVLVDEEVADEAERLLAGRTRGAPSSADGDTPPRDAPATAAE
jgi:hypothetical protein